MDNECGVLQYIVAGTRNATLLDRLIRKKYSLQLFELTNRYRCFLMKTKRRAANRNIRKFVGCFVNKAFLEIQHALIRSFVITIQLVYDFLKGNISKKLLIKIDGNDAAPININNLQPRLLTEPPGTNPSWIAGVEARIDQGVYVYSCA